MNDVRVNGSKRGRKKKKLVDWRKEQRERRVKTPHWEEEKEENKEAEAMKRIK